MKYIIGLMLIFLSIHSYARPSTYQDFLKNKQIEAERIQSGKFIPPIIEENYQEKNIVLPKNSSEGRVYLPKIKVEKNSQATKNFKAETNFHTAPKSIDIDLSKVQAKLDIPRVKTSSGGSLRLINEIGYSFQGLWGYQEGEGQGLTVEYVAFPEQNRNELFVAWYTYDLDGYYVWLTAQGSIDASTESAELTILYTVGPRFLSGEQTNIVAGTATFQLYNPREALFSYNINQDAANYLRLPQGYNEVNLSRTIPVGPGANGNLSGIQFSPIKAFDMYCVDNNTNYQPYDPGAGISVGRNGFGYSSLGRCQDAVFESQTSAEPVACNWNGDNYQPYAMPEDGPNDTDEGAVGRIGFGYSTFERCQDSVVNAQGGVMCNWNGSGYSVYNTHGGYPVTRVEGDTHYGFNDYDDCSYSVRQAYGNLVCTWNGDNYSPFNVEGGFHVGRLTSSTYYGYSDLEDCAYAVQYSSRGLVCNWNGSNYRAYSINSGFPAGSENDYNSLAACTDSIQ